MSLVTVAIPAIILTSVVIRYGRNRNGYLVIGAIAVLLAWGQSAALAQFAWAIITVAVWILIAALVVSTCGRRHRWHLRSCLLGDAGEPRRHSHRAVLLLAPMEWNRRCPGWGLARASRGPPGAPIHCRPMRMFRNLSRRFPPTTPRTAHRAPIVLPKCLVVGPFDGMENTEFFCGTGELSRPAPLIPVRAHMQAINHVTAAEALPFPPLPRTPPEARRAVRSGSSATPAPVARPLR